MQVGLINIGDEILAGKILNTNARDMAEWLRELGHETAFMLTIRDGIEPLTAALRGHFSAPGAASLADLPDPWPLPRCDLLVLSGGLGPTHDDLTRQAIAAFLDVPLEHSPLAAQWLGQRLGIAPEDIPPGQATQLVVPRGAVPLHNTAGTACGIRIDVPRVDAPPCPVFAFPGVPSEFRALFDAHCRPLLERRDAVLLRRRAVTFGLAESRQRDHLRGFTLPEPLRFSSLPNATGVTISLEAFVPLADVPATEQVLDATWNDLLARLPQECIVDRTHGEPLVPAVVAALRTRGATVSVAESCTGGLVGHLLTSVPGSSAVFKRGYLTYSDAAKRDLLGVPAETLEKFGAVSPETAEAMARGCLTASGAEYAVAVTGIAGPDGGTPEKPVGLVHVCAVSRAGGLRLDTFRYRKDRDGNRRHAAYAALNCLRLLIFTNS